MNRLNWRSIELACDGTHMDGAVGKLKDRQMLRRHSTQLQ